MASNPKGNSPTKRQIRDDVTRRERIIDESADEYSRYQDVRRELLNPRFSWVGPLASSIAAAVGIASVLGLFSLRDEVKTRTPILEGLRVGQAHLTSEIKSVALQVSATNTELQVIKTKFEGLEKQSSALASAVEAYRSEQRELQRTVDALSLQITNNNAKRAVQ